MCWQLVGIWTCTSCRQLPVLVSRLLEKTSALESLIEKLTVSNQQLVALVVEQQQDLRKLSEKTTNPITDTIDSNPKVETALVGNSLLRDVHFDGPDNRSQIRVVKKSGATLKEIEQIIDEAAKTHTRALHGPEIQAQARPANMIWGPGPARARSSCADPARKLNYEARPGPQHLCPGTARPAKQFHINFKDPARAIGPTT